MIKKSLKKKILKSCKGTLAIFLCIISAPFMLLAYSLVEFSRMQGATENISEITDMSSLSTLSNYDSYLKERFGLLALSQDDDFNLQDEYNKYFKENIKMLGGSVDSTSKSNVTGKLALGEKSDGTLNVLKSQILDYSESTVALDIINDDLGLENLLKKIDDINIVDDLLNFGNIFGAMANVTNTIKTIIDTVDIVKTAWKTVLNDNKEVQEICDGIQKEIRELSNKVYNDYKDKISNDEDKEQTANDIIKDSTYLNDIKKIYEDESKLIKYLEEIKSEISGTLDNLDTNIKNIKENCDSQIENGLEVVDKYNKKNNSNNNSNSNSSNSSSSSNSNSNNSSNNSGAIGDSFFNDVFNTSNFFECMKTSIDPMTGLVGKVKEKLKNQYELNLDELIKSIKENFKNKFGINDYDKYLTSEATVKSSAKVFIKDGVIAVIDKALGSGSVTDDSLNMAINEIFLKDARNMLIKVASINLGDILWQVIWDFLKDIVENLKKAIDWIFQMVKSLSSMFDINFICDTDLNSILSDDILSGLSKYDNEYEQFFEGFQNLYKGLNEFSEIVSHPLMVISNLIKFFTAIASVFNGIKNIITSLVTRVKNTAQQIADLVKSISTGNALKDLYENMLIAGYATHNFPNRTTRENKSTINNLEEHIELNGTATTGYEYKNIKNQKSNMIEGNPLLSLASNLTETDAILKILDNANTGGGDSTFVGAELEYINVGTKSEIINQIVSFMDVYMERLIFNLPALLLDKEALTLAEEIASVTFGIGGAAYMAIIILGEPLIDTVLLVNSPKFETSLIKTKCYLTPSGLPSLIKDCGTIVQDKIGKNGKTLKSVFKSLSKDAGDNINKYVDEYEKSKGTPLLESKQPPAVSTRAKVQGWFDAVIPKVGYNTHMFLVLFIIRSQRHTLINIGNMVQLEAMSHYDKKDYSINNAFTTIHTETEVKYGNLFSNFQLNDNQLLSDFKLVDESIMKKKYVQDRGY